MMDITNIQDDFDKAAKIFNWNKWLLYPLGLWPNKPNGIIFFLTFGYFFYQMFCEYLDLFLFIDNLEHVIENLTENMAFTTIIVRIAMLKKYNNQLGEVINEAMKDYDAKIYKTPGESKVFLDYMNRAKLFCKLLCIFVTMTATSYYAKPITSPPPPPVDADFDNFTMQFILPYRFYQFHQINDFKTYVITYATQFPFVFVSGFGQTAADCLMVSLVFHVCGKLDGLALKISTINPDSAVCKKQLKEIIVEHNRLISLGQKIEESFSEMLLVHSVAVTLLVCVLGFQILSNFANGQTSDFATLAVYMFSELLVLCSLCAVGESLVTSGNTTCKAYQSCLWYEMPHDCAKEILLCMLRSQKNLGLTAGKFGLFRLITLTETVKKSMGYLSVLRSFLTVQK